MAKHWKTWIMGKHSLKLVFKVMRYWMLTSITLKRKLQMHHWLDLIRNSQRKPSRYSMSGSINIQVELDKWIRISAHSLYMGALEKCHRVKMTESMVCSRSMTLIKMGLLIELISWGFMKILAEENLMSLEKI